MCTEGVTKAALSTWTAPINAKGTYVCRHLRWHKTTHGTGRHPTPQNRRTITTAPLQQKNKLATPHTCVGWGSRVSERGVIIFTFEGKTTAGTVCRIQRGGGHTQPRAVTAPRAPVSPRTRGSPLRGRRCAELQPGRQAAAEQADIEHTQHAHTQMHAHAHQVIPTTHRTLKSRIIFSDCASRPKSP